MTRAAWAYEDTLIGVLSDAHGNGPGFSRAIEILVAQGAGKLYFLGDAVGYIPSLSVIESIERLGNAIRCLRGNHEGMLLGEAREVAVEEVYKIGAVRNRITQEQRKMIEAWPISHIEEYEGRRLHFIHGSPSDPLHGYVYPDTPLDQFCSDADVVFMGNTHRPFVKLHRDVLFVNVGSCGLPRDDGRYGAVALYNVTRCEARILRFNLSSETHKAFDLAICRPHPKVLKSLDRRAPVIFGDRL